MEMGLASLLLPIAMCWMVGGKLGSLASAKKHYEMLLSQLWGGAEESPHFISKHTIMENLAATNEAKNQWMTAGSILTVGLFLTVMMCLIALIAHNIAYVTSSPLYPWGFIVGFLVYVATCVALFYGSYRYYYKKESDRLAMTTTR